MRVVFLGSGTFAIPSFEALLAAGHEVAALVTQPDREKGRGRDVTPPPLKPVAERHGVPVLQPLRLRDAAAQAELAGFAPEIQVVVAYGQILPRSVIDVAPRGTVNVHGSLLPHYRGAAPIQWAIARGETETGVTTMLIDAGLDTGPVLLSRATPIGDEETAAELEPRLARLGAQLLLETLDGLVSGAVKATPQDHARASLAPRIKKEDGRVDWSLDGKTIAARIRGFHPWPGAATTLDGRTIKIIRARPEGVVAGDAGTIAALDSGGIVVACGQGTSLRLVDVQPESRRPMPAAAFAAGARLPVGARFQ